MAKKDRWFFSTNTENLKMIIAQGLISAPDGFKKYYKDTLEFWPGYIPLFKNNIQKDILDYSVSETEGLQPCLIEIDLSTITGSAKFIGNNQPIDFEITNLEKVEHTLIFILAPLPISSISKIILKTKDDKKTFENDSKLYSNVPLIDLTLSFSIADQKIFNGNSSIDTYHYIDNFKNIQFNNVDNLNYNKVYAYGGFLSNLFYFAKNGTISNKVFESCVSQSNIPKDKEYSNIMQYFYEENSKEVGGFYIKIIDILIKSNDSKEEIIQFLQSNEKTEHIAKKLLNFESISDKPVSEELREAKTLFGKALLMLFLREDSEALMEYYLDIFKEEDYIIFAMLFGIRDKFIKIPKFLREFNGLQKYITSKMANYAHMQMNGSIKFSEPKQLPTVMDMLKSNRFKEYFAKELKIEECFQTIIPKSDYIVEKGKPVFKGIVIPKFELLEEEYFKNISKTKLFEYNKYLQKYEKVK